MATRTQKSTSPRAPREVYTVSELSEILRGLLEDSLPSLWVQGELSNFRNPGGHWYFTLKDANAQIRCAMFKGQNIYVRPLPKDGDAVLVRARVSLYVARGDLQLIVEHLEPAGEGALLRAFEQLKAKLAAEGLFGEKLKRPIPQVPHGIGVITSSTGAAYQDILTTLRRRYPLGSVYLYPVPVQGDAAAPAIVEALTKLPKLAPVDVVILARGGGSLEDLWCFNDERVARAIRACAVPVVTGVGHEIDFTIADFAADLRAPTPTGAAERVSPDVAEWKAQIESLRTTLHDDFERFLQNTAERLDRAYGRLQTLHPGRRLQQTTQRLDELYERLRLAAAAGTRLRAQRALHLRERLFATNPAGRIQMQQRQLAVFDTLLRTHLHARVRDLGSRLARTSALLESLNPKAVLERGYAIVRKMDGKVVRDAATLAPGDTLDTLFAAGRAVSEVRKTFSSE